MNRFLSPEHVTAAVCAFFKVSFAQVASQSQVRETTAVRHELMCMLREFTQLSAQKIGVLVGGRDHKSVLHAIGRVSARAVLDPSYGDHVEQLRRFVLAYDEAPAGHDALERARRCMSPDSPLDRAEVSALGISLLAAVSILGSRELTDAEARLAALTVLTRTGGRNDAAA